MRFPKTLLAAAIAATLVGHGALAQTIGSAPGARRPHRSSKPRKWKVRSLSSMIRLSAKSCT